jgi:hypothetical protein
VSAILRRSCCHALAARYLANIRPQDIAKFGHHISQALGRPRDGRPIPPGSSPRGLARRPCCQSCIVGGSSTTTTRPGTSSLAPDQRTWSRMTALSGTRPVEDGSSVGTTPSLAAPSQRSVSASPLRAAGVTRRSDHRAPEGSQSRAGVAETVRNAVFRSAERNSMRLQSGRCCKADWSRHARQVP